MRLVMRYLNRTLSSNAKSCYAKSKPLVECLLSSNVLHTSLVSCEILLFSNANWIFSANHKSIDISLASLLQVQILPRFFDTILLLEKSTKFGALKLIFDPRTFTFVISHDRKDSGDNNTSGFGTRPA